MSSLTDLEYPAVKVLSNINRITILKILEKQKTGMTLGEIRKAMSEEYEISITPQNLHRYLDDLLQLGILAKEDIIEEDRIVSKYKLISIYQTEKILEYFEELNMYLKIITLLGKLRRMNSTYTNLANRIGDAEVKIDSIYKKLNRVKNEIFEILRELRKYKPLLTDENKRYIEFIEGMYKFDLVDYSRKIKFNVTFSKNPPYEVGDEVIITFDIDNELRTPLKLVLIEYAIPLGFSFVSSADFFVATRNLIPKSEILIDKFKRFEVSVVARRIGNYGTYVALSRLQLKNDLVDEEEITLKYVGEKIIVNQKTIY